MVFGQGRTAIFDSGWEVLMAQREVQNWVRSTSSKAEPMRYPGEWVFAGGNVDDGETPEQAARRELEEEFLLQLPADPSACRLHLLSVAQTRPIRDVSNIMYNYVAMVEENPWLELLDVGAVNAALHERRARHQAQVQSGAYWSLSKEEREHVAPEMRKVRWLDLRSAILNAFTSMNQDVVPVNAFQEKEFGRLGIVRRDPMFITMVSLLEVESFPSVASLMRYADQFSPEEALCRKQWLWEGMSPQEVFEAWKKPAGLRREGMFINAEGRVALRDERRKEDEEHALRDAKRVRRGRL